MCATIVVVEKNAAVRELIERTLQGEGHRVLVTPALDEALAVADTVHVDLLVVHGRRVVSSLASDLPAVRCLDVETLGKPFPLGALIAAVDDALAGEPGQPEVVDS